MTSEIPIEPQVIVAAHEFSTTQAIRWTKPIVALGTRGVMGELDARTDGDGGVQLFDKRTRWFQ
jgi:hypothetical protein